MLSIDNGAYVVLVGRWIPSQGAGQSHELQVEQIETMGTGNASVCPGAKGTKFWSGPNSDHRTTQSRSSQCRLTSSEPSLTSECVQPFTPYSTGLAATS